MKEMLLFISSLRRTYHLYIGEGDLIAFKHFIDGYITCLSNTHQLSDLELYEQMCDFIERHYLFNCSSHSVFDKIQENTNSKQESFMQFFDLLDEFILANDLNQ